MLGALTGEGLAKTAFEQSTSDPLPGGGSCAATQGAGLCPDLVDTPMRVAESLAPVVLAIGIACGGSAGGAGSPPPPCTAGDPCAPTNACRVGVVSCETGSPVCQDTDDVLLDGTACGPGAVCSAGTCVDRSATRTITGTFQTVYESDDGSTTTIGEPPRRNAVVAALVIPDGSAEGYARFPVTVASDGSFAVADVPVGRWFLELDADVFVSNAASPPAIVLASRLS